MEGAVVPQAGLLVPGNIDMSTRPRVKNADGSISTVRSISVGIDGGREVLIPTVSDDGRVLSDRDAIDLYKRTGKHLGIFKDVPSANSYAEALHESEAAKLMPVDYDANGQPIQADAAPSSHDYDASGIPLDAVATAREHVAEGKPVPHSAVHSILDWAEGLVTGAVKGAANTAIGLGEAAYNYVPLIGQASDAAQKAVFGDVQPAGPLFAQARKDMAPEGAAEKLGYTGEQVGEFFLPTGAAGSVGKAAEVGKAALLGRAQSGSNVAGAVSGALTAALPGAGAAKRLAGQLEEGAEKGVVQALGPTKEWAKVEAAKLAPQMLARGVGGSRAAMLQQAETKSAELGKALSAEVAAAAARGETVSGPLFSTAIDHARSSLTVQDAKGIVRAIPGTEAVIKRLDKLDQFVKSLGNDVPIDQAQHVKQVWDKIVSKAGLYGQKSGGSATDNATAWATREGASAFRKLISTGNATIDDINKEFAFWKGLRNVLKETGQRTQSHGAGLTSAILSAAGASAGYASGSTLSDRVQNAIIGGVAGRKLTAIMRSPWWQTKMVAPLKYGLAHALSSGNVQAVEGAVKRIVAAMPAQLRPAEAQ